jgi:hypothetical protein
VAVGSGGHLDRGVTEAALHDLDREFESAIRLLPCTTLIGSSSPPSAFRLVDHEAQKCRSACKPGYLGPSGVTRPARVCTGCQCAHHGRATPFASAILNRYFSRKQLT